jgi:Holliday junction resolvase RusA-like endonuclease
MFCMKRTLAWQRARHGKGPILDVRKPDIDNLAKSLLDGMVASGVITDDSQVFDLRALKLMHEVGGRPHAWVAMEWRDAIR